MTLSTQTKPCAHTRSFTYFSLAPDVSGSMSSKVSAEDIFVRVDLETNNKVLLKNLINLADNVTKHLFMFK